MRTANCYRRTLGSRRCGINAAKEALWRGVAHPIAIRCQPPKRAVEEGPGVARAILFWATASCSPGTQFVATTPGAMVTRCASAVDPGGGANLRLFGPG